MMINGNSACKHNQGHKYTGVKSDLMRINNGLIRYSLISSYHNGRKI